MELLLRLADIDGTEDPLDVSVDVEPNESVGALAERLREYAGEQGFTVPPPDRVRLISPRGRPIDPGVSVMASGIGSGDTIVLCDGAPPGERPSDVEGVIAIDVASGPDAGRFVLLEPGTYQVGRASDCDIVIDDPTLSRRHLTVEVLPSAQVSVVPDSRATNGTFVADTEIAQKVVVGPQDLVRAGSTTLGFRRPGAEQILERDLLGQVPFNRVPYRRTLVRERVMDQIPAPPERPQRRKLALAAAMIPLVGGIAMAVMMGRPQFLILAALSPIAFGVRHLSERRSGRRTFVNETSRFHESVRRAAAEAAEAVEEERRDRLNASTDLAALARQARFRQRHLWERSRGAEDFLVARLGLGTLDSRVRVELQRGGDQELRDWAEAELDFHHKISRVPVTVDLARIHTFGVFGDRATVTSVGDAIILQALCLHSPEDLVLVAAAPDEGADEFAWLKWAPHTRAATSPLDGPHLVAGPADTRRLLLSLLGVATERAQQRGSGGDAATWPRILFLLHEDAQPDRALLSQLLDVASATGIVTIWLGHDELQLPRQCWATLRCEDPGLGAKSSLQFIDPDLDDCEVELEIVGRSTAEEVARRLAPVRDGSAATVTTALPREVSLLDVLEMPQPSGAALWSRWARPRPYGLRAAVGQSAAGIFELDLVEDGPHALIAGTSGSGKSELLQTLVASLATNYPPSRLNFLFVDYKGGASSSEFRDLPHSVGYVTNLSGSFSMRALTSLRAELKRRMALLEGRAKDLKSMLEVAPQDAPPSLVIVVDEFATLVKEIPDFVAGIVDIAQRGRSLGIHLLLATQRPAGAVNENILANTNLRIALRVLDANDSASVIGSKEAADIPGPLRGRAYARLGPRQLTAFQSAWSGAPYTPTGPSRTIEVSPFGFSRSGDGKGARQQAKDSANGSQDTTQLSAVVEAAAAAAREGGLSAPRRPWLEPLPKVVMLQDVIGRVPDSVYDDPGRFAVLGMIDDPENQAQHPALVDLEQSGGLVVFGTGGAGKSSVLRSIAASLSQQGSAEVVELVALDFASRTLEQLEHLPHCGAVANGDDLERVSRVLTVLNKEISHRRGLIGASGAESLSALRRLRGEAVLPRIVLMVDGFGGFQSTFDKPETYEWIGHMQRVVTEGRHVGIHVVLTADRRTSVPGAVYSSISARLVLRMADPEEMAILGVPAKVARESDLIPGRGFLDGAVEVQVASVTEDPSGVSQSEGLAALATRLAKQSRAVASGLPELPDDVALAPRSEMPVKPLQVPFAVEDLSLDVQHVALERSSLVIAGPPCSGKSTALMTVTEGLAGAGLSLVAIGSGASPLAELDVWEDAAFSRGSHARLVDAVLAAAQHATGAGVRTVLFVDEADDVEDECLRSLEKITKLDSVRLAVAADISTASRSHSGWMAQVRRSRSLMLLQPESRQEVEQVAGVKIRFRPGQLFPPGRGVLVTNRKPKLVQVVRGPNAAG